MSSTKRYVIGALSRTVREWAADPEVRERGIGEAHIRTRLMLGWSIDRAITEPVREQRGSQSTLRASKATIYLDGETVDVVARLSKKLDRSLSWIVQQCVTGHAAALEEKWAPKPEKR